MFKASLLLFFVVLMTSNSQAYNLDDWPCVQRYIPELSANVVWQQQPNKQNPQLSEPVAQQNIVSLSTDLRTDIVLFENTINDYLEQNKEVIGLRNLLFYDIFESILFVLPFDIDVWCEAGAVRPGRARECCAREVDGEIQLRRGEGPWTLAVGELSKRCRRLVNPGTAT